MGDYADLIADGVLCQLCGELVDADDDNAAPGYPRLCQHCEREQAPSSQRQPSRAVPRTTFSALPPLDARPLADAKAAVLVRFPGIDDRTAEFCALVDCDPSEVRDAPAGYDFAGATKRAEDTDTPKEKLKRFGRRPMPYGKYKGVPLLEVPRSYLEWMINAGDGPGSTPASRKFKKQLSHWWKKRGRWTHGKNDN